MAKEDLEGMPLAAVVQAWMDAEEWEDDLQISEDRSTSRVATQFGVDGQAYNLFIDTSEGDNVVEVYLYSPYKVPPARMEAVSRVLNRIHTRLNFGRLCCADDEDSNSVVFTDKVYVGDSKLSEAQITNMIRAATGTFASWGSLLAAVAMTKLPVEQLWKEHLAEMKAAREAAKAEEGPSEL